MRVVISGGRPLSLGQVLLILGKVAQIALSEEADYQGGMLATVFHCVDVSFLNGPAQLDNERVLMGHK